jgi:drug/metabolite transporter (DMT)-like permease
VTPPKVLGVVVGFGGVLLIARPWEADGAVSTSGVLYMLLGSASVGLSSACPGPASRTSSTTSSSSGSAR